MTFRRVFSRFRSLETNVLPQCTVQHSLVADPANACGLVLETNLIPSLKRISGLLYSRKPLNIPSVLERAEDYTVLGGGAEAA
jgi:hypothetical protein